MDASPNLKPKGQGLRFAIGFAIAAGVTFLAIAPSPANPWLHLAKVVAAGVAGGFLVAKFGDRVIEYAAKASSTLY